MSRGPDAATLLERRLRIAAEAAGVAATVGESDWTRWASATFVGARHRVPIGGSGVAFDAWVAALAEAELPLRGHLVADVAVVARSGDRVVVEVLTVEER
ncbi:hypothetical protein [Sphingomonas sp. SAFR-052]|uniref:hypothetical protein n=1 Tax=Sphingomonas sp. SAFR-052 TaxID=3436867 RepID=UPI003F816B4C